MPTDAGLAEMSLSKSFLTWAGRTILKSLANVRLGSSQLPAVIDQTADFNFYFYSCSCSGILKTHWLLATDFFCNVPFCCSIKNNSRHESCETVAVRPYTVREFPGPFRDKRIKRLMSYVPVVDF